MLAAAAAAVAAAGREAGRWQLAQLCWQAAQKLGGTDPAIQVGRSFGQSLTADPTFS